MAHYDIFRHHLGIEFPAYGHALWEPDPGNLYPAVEVGDVGYIRQGKFHRLFNVFLPAEDESHVDFGVPEYHEQLTLNIKKHINIGKLSPNNFCSAKVTSMPVSEHLAEGPDEIPEVTFSCPMKEGAVLCLPIQAKGENTVASADFGKWIIRHIDRWFAWARQRGLGVDRMEDIILVTGTHRTRSWTNVAFPGGQEDAQASFGAKADHRGDVVAINWQISHERNRGVLLNCGPDGKDLPEDQCIFIRGFRVTRKFKILPRLKGAAGPSPDPKGDDGDPELELIPIPAIPEYRDPLHILLEYIAEEAPSDCDILLVHDDDLARRHAPLDALQRDRVLSNIRSLKPTLHNTRINLSSVCKSSSADTEYAWVATLSNIFEKQSLPPPSTQSPAPLANPIGGHVSAIPGDLESELGTKQHQNQPAVLPEVRAPDSAHLPQAPLGSTSPQISLRNDYPEKGGTTSSISPNNRLDFEAYPSYNGASQAQPGYSDSDAYADYLIAAQGNPALQEPRPLPTSYLIAPQGNPAFPGSHPPPTGSFDITGNPYIPRIYQNIRLALGPNDLALHPFPAFPPVDHGPAMLAVGPTANEEETASGADDIDDNLVPIEDHEYPTYFRQIGLPPRLFHSHGSYVLPVDSVETKRQEAQHILLRMIIGSNYDAPVRELLNNNPSGRKVVDLCTGAGHWVLEMAKEFPQVKFSGLDLVPIQTRYPPENVRFEIADVTERLGFADASVDVVHARMACLSAFCGKSRILRPGGLFLSAEWDSRPTLHHRNPWVKEPEEYIPHTIRFFDTASNVVPTLARSIPALIHGNGSFEEPVSRQRAIPISVPHVAEPPGLLFVSEVMQRIMQGYADALVARRCVPLGVAESFKAELRGRVGIVYVYQTVFARKMIVSPN